jgi:hypothetical protein
MSDESHFLGLCGAGKLVDVFMAATKEVALPLRLPLLIRAEVAV